MMYNLGSMHCIINTANSTGHGTEPASEPEGQLVSSTCLKTLQPPIHHIKASLRFELCVQRRRRSSRIHPAPPCYSPALWCAAETWGLVRQSTTVYIWFENSVSCIPKSSFLYQGFCFRNGRGYPRAGKQFEGLDYWRITKKLQVCSGQSGIE